MRNFTINSLLAACLFAIGCAHVEYPLAPPPPMPTDAVAVPGQNAEVGVGGSMLVIPGPLPNLLDGVLPIRLGYGLSDWFDIALIANPITDSTPGGGVRLGYQIVKTPRFELGAIGGLGMNYAHEIDDLTRCDSSGARCAQTHYDYRYLSFAPHAGLRAAVEILPHLKLVGMGWEAYGFPIHLAGTKVEQTQALWTQALVGAVYGPLQGLEFGLGLGGSAPIGIGDADSPFPTVQANASLSYRFALGH